MIMISYAAMRKPRIVLYGIGHSPCAASDVHSPRLNERRRTLPTVKHVLGLLAAAAIGLLS